ncbi:MAG TPA: hypothetical protein VF789_05915 [Thermoanaerobaculia bacterium]
MAAPWESLSSKLADQWLAALLTPAFAFWLGGAALTLMERGAWGQALTWLEQQKTSSQVLLLVVILLLTGLSAFVVQRFTWAALRFLEGYWPALLSPLSGFMLTRKRKRIERLEARFASLSERFDDLTPQECRKYQELEARLLWVPSELSDLMPTRLGNVLRTAESRPRIKYGLDGVLCWPRLWLLLPPLPREELSEARARLDSAAQLWIWGILFCFWSVSSLWALPIGIMVAVFAYRSAVAGGVHYGELIDSSYDLYRREIYAALRWPLPRNPAEERELGKEITSYLLRGSDQDRPVFDNPEARPQSPDPQATLLKDRTRRVAALLS